MQLSFAARGAVLCDGGARSGSKQAAHKRVSERPPRNDARGHHRALRQGDCEGKRTGDAVMGEPIYEHCGRPVSRDAYWLMESQHLITNVWGLINRGKTETADSLIADYYDRYLEDSQRQKV